jgi:hypothetical protein
MSATISLGKDYTITGGISNVSDLTLNRQAEKIDITTRAGSDPLKFTAAGLPKITLECTVIAESSTSYSIGQSVSVASSGYTGALIVTNADRDEPDDGPVTYKLTLTPGVASATPVEV